MRIETSTIEDIETIVGLYEDADAYQKIITKQALKEFDPKLLEPEIRQERHWKIIIDEQIACVFTISFEDSTFWGTRAMDQAIYIHRIATNPLFRGNSFVKYIVTWSRLYARQNGRRYIRVHTAAGNLKLAGYFISCGFNYMGRVKFESEELPVQRKQLYWALFEIII